jgi:hypothetical protein
MSFAFYEIGGAYRGLDKQEQGCDYHFDPTLDSEHVRTMFGLG